MMFLNVQMLLDSYISAICFVSYTRWDHNILVAQISESHWKTLQGGENGCTDRAISIYDSYSDNTGFEL